MKIQSCHIAMASVVFALSQFQSFINDELYRFTLSTNYKFVSIGNILHFIELGLNACFWAAHVSDSVFSSLLLVSNRLSPASLFVFISLANWLYISFLLCFFVILFCLFLVQFIYLFIVTLFSIFIMLAFYVYFRSVSRTSFINHTMALFSYALIQA